MLLFFAVVLCCALVVPAAHAETVHRNQLFRSGNDVTVQDEVSGTDVVKAVVEKIETTCIFKKDKQMLRVIALQESSNGRAAHTFRPHYYGGIWQIDEHLFENTKQSSLQPFWSRFTSAFGIDWNAVQWTDLTKPLYSGLAARLLLALSANEVTARSLVSDVEAKSFLDGALPWNVQLQANIWIQAYEKTSDANILRSDYAKSASLLPSTSSCKSIGADIAFVMDSSGSIPSEDFANSLQFVAAVVRKLRIGPTHNQVAVSVYSSGASVPFHLNQLTSQQQIIDRTLAIPYEGGGTATAVALQLLHQEIFTPANGARTNRPKIAVLFTDGASNNYAETIQQAQIVQSRDITLISVGIGNGINAVELEDVASEPKCRNLYHLQNFGDMAEIFAMEIEERSCDEPVVIVPPPIDGDTGVLPPPIEVVLEPGQVQNICFEVLTAQGATLIVNGTVGSLTVYISLSTNRPSELNYDRKLRVSAGEVKKEFLTKDIITALVGNLITHVKICVSIEGGPSHPSGPSDPWNPDEISEGNSPAPVYPEGSTWPGIDVPTTAAPISQGGIIIVPEITDCGAGEEHLKDGDEILITSPGFTSQNASAGYRNGLNCVWKINTPSWTHLEVTIEYLNLPKNPSVAAGARCIGQDRIVVTNRNNQAESGGYLCGARTKSPPFKSTTNVTTFTFTSVAQAGPGYGFSLKIRAVGRHLLDCNLDKMVLELRKVNLQKDMPLEEYHLLDAACGATDTGDSLTMESGYSQCGTRAIEEDATIYFVNHVKAEVVPPANCRPPCRPPKPFELPFRCKLDRKIAPLSGEYEALRAAQLPFLEGTVQVDVALNIFHDANFDPETFPTFDEYEVADYDDVFVEVAVQNGENSPFVIQADQCWVTPTANKDDNRRYEFLSSGCPTDTEAYFTRHWSETWQDRFSMKSFIFPQTASTKLYFHCVVRVCVVGIDEHLCSKTCSNARSYHTFMRTVGLERKTAARRIAQFGPIQAKEGSRIVNI